MHWLIPCQQFKHLDDDGIIQKAFHWLLGRLIPIAKRRYCGPLMLCFFMNKLLTKPSNCCWFQTLSWRHYNGMDVSQFDAKLPIWIATPWTGVKYILHKTNNLKWYSLKTITLFLLLFPWIQMTIFQQAPNRRHAITWIKDDQVRCHHVLMC